MPAPACVKFLKTYMVCFYKHSKPKKKLDEKKGSSMKDIKLEVVGQWDVLINVFKVSGNRTRASNFYQQFYQFSNFGTKFGYSSKLLAQENFFKFGTFVINFIKQI